MTDLTEADIRVCIFCGLYVPIGMEHCCLSGRSFEVPTPPILTVSDPVNHPPHYTQHPSGIECIQITEHMGFNLGNAVKYIWRADLKDNAIEDLKKAIWYVEREIQKRGKT